MNSKLTLSLNQNIIEQAKALAKKNGNSLSKMIEDYFRSVISHKGDGVIKITPNVKNLTGVIDLPTDYDDRKSYRQHIVQKYAKV